MNKKKICLLLTILIVLSLVITLLQHEVIFKRNSTSIHALSFSFGPSDLVITGPGDGGNSTLSGLLWSTDNGRFLGFKFATLMEMGISENGRYMSNEMYLISCGKIFFKTAQGDSAVTLPIPTKPEENRTCNYTITEIK